MPWADSREIQSRYWCLTWHPPHEQIADAIELAQSLNVAGFEYEDGEAAVSPFTDIPLMPGQPYVRAYLPLTQPALAEHVRAVCEARGWALSQETVQSADWANAWKAYYQPQIVREDYAIVPAWYDESPRDAVHTLWLDPGMAFGTGTHPTTRMCLQALAAYDVAGKSVLDLGAGSGILGLFAVLRGAQRVVMVEPDPVAVDAIWHNARINHLENKISVVAGTLQNLDPGPYDILCLNLIWDIIHQEWPSLARYRRPGSLLLLSGLLPDKRPQVADMVSRMDLLRMEEREGWLLAVVRDGSAGG